MIQFQMVSDSLPNILDQCLLLVADKDGPLRYTIGCLHVGDKGRKAKWYAIDGYINNELDEEEVVLWARLPDLPQRKKDEDKG